MRKTTQILLLFVAVSLVAQTSLSPIRVNWKNYLVWDDPNPPGTVGSWAIVASNGVVQRKITNAPSALRRIDYQVLLNGLPEGAYAICTIPLDLEMFEGNAGTNHFVSWPGGNGKPNGGTNLRTTR